MPEFVNKNFSSSDEMCSDILKKTGVALLPGSDFGFSKNKMIVRLSFTDFDGHTFMKNVSDTENIDDNLISNKIIINKPEGGFYLMPEFLIEKFSTSEEMCSSILKDTGVALLPGSDFGFSKNKMIVRLSFTDFDGRTFMKNVSDTENIDENLISRFAPNIVEGVNNLKRWSEST